MRCPLTSSSIQQNVRPTRSINIPNRSPATFLYFRPCTTDRQVQIRQLSCTAHRARNPPAHRQRSAPPHHDIQSFLASTAARMRALEDERSGDNSTVKSGVKNANSSNTASVDVASSSGNSKLKDPTTSTVFLGTRYEYLAKHRLEAPEFGMRLTRTGGRGDKGVDLLGIWRLPADTLPAKSSSGTSSSSVDLSHVSSQTTSPPKTQSDQPYRETPLLRVLIQTKRLTAQRAPHPSHLRELEGTLNASFPLLPPSTLTPLNPTALAWRQFIATSPDLFTDPKTSNPEAEREQILTNPSLPTLGIFVSTAPSTKGVQEVLRSSTRAMLYIQLRELEPESSSQLNSRTESAESSSGSGSGSSNNNRTTHIPGTKIAQILWNQAASDLGLQRYAVITRNHDSSISTPTPTPTPTPTAEIRGNDQGPGEAVLIHL